MVAAVLLVLGVALLLGAVVEHYSDLRRRDDRALDAYWSHCRLMRDLDRHADPRHRPEAG